MTQENTQVKKSKICDCFTMVKDQNGKVFIAVGEFKISNKSFDTFDQAERYIGTKPYEIIINLIGLAIYEKEKKTSKGTKRTAKISETNNKKLQKDEK